MALACSLCSTRISALAVAQLIFLESAIDVSLGSIDASLD